MPEADLVGKKFNRWTVLKHDGYNRYDVMWLCRCSCPAKTLKRVISYSLTGGTSKSCGCLQKEWAATGNGNRRHSLSRSRIYRIWNGMIQRCHNKNMKDYPDYGGRGIAVCALWRRSFLSFNAWATKNGYADDLEIDRIKNHKGYSPSNCQWVKRIKNGNNKRNTKWFKAFGETKTLSEWSRDLRCKVTYRVLRDRIFLSKWKPETALTKRVST